MENAANEENNATTPVNNHPPLPTTVELCTQFILIRFWKEFYNQFLKRFFAIKKLDIFFVSYFLRHKCILEASDPAACGP